MKFRAAVPPLEPKVMSEALIVPAASFEPNPPILRVPTDPVWLATKMVEALTAAPLATVSVPLPESPTVITPPLASSAPDPVTTTEFPVAAASDPMVVSLETVTVPLEMVRVLLAEPSPTVRKPLIFHAAPEEIRAELPLLTPPETELVPPITAESLERMALSATVTELPLLLSKPTFN